MIALIRMLAGAAIYALEHALTPKPKPSKLPDMRLNPHSYADDLPLRPQVWGREPEGLKENKGITSREGLKR